MQVDEYANGRALLSSEPVRIKADEQSVLSFTWVPHDMPQEASFFWRRSDDPQNIRQTEIITAGKQLINLDLEPEWQGEITEFGFLFTGTSGEIVEIGDVSLLPDSLDTRLQLAWRAWTSFEPWSQQSINFLHGGDYRQVIALPILVAAWLLTTLILLWLFLIPGKTLKSRQLLITAGFVFLAAWVVLDIRWSFNNLRQIQLSMDSLWHTDDRQYTSTDLDEGIYQYVQNLKADILGDQPTRILIIGDEEAVEYYLMRAKYHLLPHSVDVAGRFREDLAPGSLDFVIFFGKPINILKVPGWDATWRRSLKRVERGEWGVVYQVR